MKSKFRQAGGRLNNVDGVITGYEFTDVFPFGDNNKPSKSGFRSLYTVLSVRQDGADEDILEPLWSGDADAFDISEDGQTLTPTAEGYMLGGNTNIARFVTSLETAGHPGCQADDGEEGDINFAPMVGTRCRFIQAQQVGKDGKTLTRVVKDGKYKGKTFDNTTTEVGAYYGAAAPVGKAKTASARRPIPAVVKTTSKANGRAATTPNQDIAELAASTLADILAEAVGNSVPKAKLRMKVFAALGTKHPQRDEVIKFLYDDDNLMAIDGVTYDAADKAQTISLA